MLAVPLWALFLGCQTPIEVPAGTSDGALDRWDHALERIVDDDGQVHFVRLKAHRQQLADFLTWLDDTELPKTHWARMAHSLNAFHAVVLWTLLERDAPPKLLDVGPRAHPEGSWYGWRTIRLGTDAISLWEIEHELLRTKPQEYRVHAAIWRGTVSSPPLLKGVYRRTSIARKLDHQMVTWLQDPEQGAAIVDGRAVLPYAFEVHSHDFFHYSGGLDPCALVSFYMPEADRPAWEALSQKGCPWAYRPFDLTVDVVR